MIMNLNINVKGVAIFLLSFFLFINLSAKQRDNSYEKADERSENLKQELVLNENQFNKIKEINRQFTDEMKKLRSETSDRESMRSTMKEYLEKRDLDIKEELTEDQKVEYDKFILEEKKNNQGQRGTRRR